MNLQDAFLNHLRVKKIPVTIYLISGFQIKGLVTGFDAFIVMLESSGKQNMVYKHAISTMMPARPVPLFKPSESEEEEPEQTEGETDGQPVV